jgi:hypothetical protein
MKKLVLPLLFSFATFASAQVHVAPDSAVWSLVTGTANESGSIHTFSRGTTDGVSTASGFTNRRASTGGQPVEWNKTDNISGKLTFRVKWYGSWPGNSTSALLKVSRTVKISGYLSGNPVPNLAQWIRTQHSGSFWDPTCPWLFSVSILYPSGFGYNHPDNNQTIQLLDLNSTAHFDSTLQPGGFYYGTIELWPYWAQVTQALVQGGLSSVQQDTNVKYGFEIYKVGGLIVDGFSGGNGSGGGNGGGGQLPPPGNGGGTPPGGGLLAILLEAGRAS